MSSFHKAVSIIYELYICSPLEGLITHVIKNLDTVIIYISTILVTLTAIALPLAQQSLQWLEDKIQSENLTEYVKNSSYMNSSVIVPRVFIFLLICLAFYLLTPILPLLVTVTLFIAGIFYFSWVIYAYIKHFNYIFKTLGSSSLIHEELLKKSNDGQITKNEISLVMDMEGTKIAERPEKVDIDDRLRKLGYVLLRSESINSIELMESYLNGIYKILYRIPLDANQIKYTKIASLLSYLSFQLLLDENRAPDLNRLHTLTLWLESRRADKYKPFISARFFSEIKYKKGRNNINEDHLINYVSSLISIAKKEDKEIVIELYKNLCMAMSYRDCDESDLSYFFHDRVDVNLWTSDISEILKKALTSSKTSVNKKYLIALLNQHGVDVNERESELITEFLDEVWDLKVRRKIKDLSLQFILDFSNREDLILQLRGVNNPIFSSVNMMIRDILPSSTMEIFRKILHGLDIQNDLLINNSEDHILKSSAALLIYEGIKCQSNNKDLYLNCDSFSYRELETIEKITEKLGSKVRIISDNPKVSEFIIDHYSTPNEVIANTTEFLRELKTTIGERKNYLSSSAPLSKKIVGRLKTSILTETKKDQTLKNVLKRVKVSGSCQHQYRLELSRFSFLEDTGHYHDFSNIGSFLIHKHLDQQLNEILMNKGQEALREFPKKKENNNLILMTSSVKNKLSELGYEFHNSGICWEKEKISEYYVIKNTNQEKFYCVKENESIFNIQKGVKDMMEVSIVDNGEKVVVLVSFFFCAKV